jgi:TPR repeat protein
MRNLTATICLTIALLLGSVGCSSPTAEGGLFAGVSQADRQYAVLQGGLIAAQKGDYATALREWTPIAKQGNARAQSNLGLMYYKGHGVPQNHKTAVKWYRLAAKQGYANAQSNLGFMYDKGRGVPQNKKTAVKWYRLAAKQGFARAQSNLGLMYYKGHGVPQNHKTAVKWWNLSAKQGYAKSQHNLGLMYEKGKGVSQDYKTAVKWYRLAAKQGYAHAQSKLLRPDLQVIIKESERLALIERERQRVADIESERLALIERERQRVAVINAKMQKIISRLKPSCTAFGFKDGSSELSKCLFDLYKIEQEKEQKRAAAAEQTIQYKSAIDSRNANAAARASQIETQNMLVREQLQEQKKQRQLEGSLELMRRGLEMMSPPKPKLTCKYNSFTKTTVCN